MTDQQIGERIRRARNARLLSQDELAERIGFKSGSAIGDLERGERTLTVPVAQRLAEATNVPISWFVDEMPSLAAVTALLGFTPALEDAKLPNYVNSPMGLRCVRSRLNRPKAPQPSIKRLTCRKPAGMPGRA